MNIPKQSQAVSNPLFTTYPPPRSSAKLSANKYLSPPPVLMLLNYVLALLSSMLSVLFLLVTVFALLFLGLGALLQAGSVTVNPPSQAVKKTLVLSEPVLKQAQPPVFPMSFEKLQAVLTKLNFQLPVIPGELPTDGRLYPGAPRDYRNGKHAGIDFFGPAKVVAALAGRVVYMAEDSFNAEQRQSFLLALSTLPPGRGDGFEDVLRRMYGRQVILEHAYGIRTRYAHLHHFAPGLKVGDQIRAGQELGVVGNSGTQAASWGRFQDGIHLHWELLIPPDYKAYALGRPEIRYFYHRLFQGAQK